MTGKAEEAKKRLIVALDVDTAEQAESLVRQLAPWAGMFKVGMQLFYSAGPDVVKRLKDQGLKVFLDLKLHDIPNTVAQAARALTGLGADILNVHAAGCLSMMRAAGQAVADRAGQLQIPAPMVIAVTVLTSIDQTVFNREMGQPGEIKERVKAWARLTQEAGLAGVVASPRETGLIREVCGPDFAVITPGIRPAWSVSGDQRRVLSPAEALALGSSYLVVGRPITAAADPAEAARKVLAEMTGGC